jgi:hypothetical protein
MARKVEDRIFMDWQSIKMKESAGLTGKTVGKELTKRMWINSSGLTGNLGHRVNCGLNMERAFSGSRGRRGGSKYSQN